MPSPRILRRDAWPDAHSLSLTGHINAVEITAFTQQVRPAARAPSVSAMRLANVVASIIHSGAQPTSRSPYALTGRCFARFGAAAERGRSAPFQDDECHEPGSNDNGKNDPSHGVSSAVADRAKQGNVSTCNLGQPRARGSPSPQAPANQHAASAELGKAADQAAILLWMPRCRSMSRIRARRSSISLAKPLMPAPAIRCGRRQIRPKCRLGIAVAVMKYS